MQKRNKTNATWRLGGSSRAVTGSHFCSGTAYNAYDAYAETSRAESFNSARLVLNGDNMLRLCDPSNLLFEYSFYLLRSDALFSNYFEDLLYVHERRSTSQRSVGEWASPMKPGERGHQSDLLEDRSWTISRSRLAAGADVKGNSQSGGP